VDPEIEHLVTELLPQARSEARKAWRRAPALDREELVSLAYTGLAMAASAWSGYCERNGFDVSCGTWPCQRPDICGTRFFAAYALRRMRGAILDYQRQADWVSRSVRTRARAIRDAGYDLGTSEADTAAQTGLTPAQIRDTIAAVARRPVSADAEPVDVAEDDDVEGQAQVRLLLAAAVDTIRTLPEEVQIVLALRYYSQAEPAEIASLLNRTADEVAVFHMRGITAVRAAMVQAAAE
jgi:RNA polymerase sigma factor (sigma-70 family)